MIRNVVILSRLCLICWERRPSSSWRWKAFERSCIRWCESSTPSPSLLQSRKCRNEFKKSGVKVACVRGVRASVQYRHYRQMCPDNWLGIFPHCFLCWKVFFLFFSVFLFLFFHSRWSLCNLKTQSNRIIIASTYICIQQFNLWLMGFTLINFFYCFVLPTYSTFVFFSK